MSSWSHIPLYIQYGARTVDEQTLLVNNFGVRGYEFYRFHKMLEEKILITSLKAVEQI